MCMCKFLEAATIILLVLELKEEENKVMKGKRKHYTTAKNFNTCANTAIYSYAASINRQAST